MTYRVVELREEPEHLDPVAEWTYREWWEDPETPPAVLHEALRPFVQGDVGGFPAAFVAVWDGGRPVGSVLLHRTEAPDRPEFTPYLGALYVLPGWRRRGIGAALVRAIEERARDLGHGAVYLNTLDRAGYYESLGWQVVERGYGRANETILVRGLLPAC